ncbi:recombinase family protein [Halogeometricum borinquense]|uniref:recombinase family protein n=1 Tax=Halogeometricum borinquense TaxID=60847 RepID=UPI00341B1DC3
MTRAAIYARVSTEDQDVQRQLDETREFLQQHVEADEVVEYPEVISGATSSGERDVYDQLWDDIAAGEFDIVVVHEISRLSRLGGTEVYDFIQHCLEHETGVESLDVGLSIRVDDPALKQTLYTMVANIMGDLAKIEHQQKLQRIQSGIRAAQAAGKWTGRPPRGFTVGDDGRLHVDVEEFLATREALARIAQGESRTKVAEDTGIPQSTLTRLYDDRRDLYLAGEGEGYDDRVDAAVEELRPLDDLEPDEAGKMEARMRRVVREELEAFQEESDDA